MLNVEGAINLLEDGLESLVLQLRELDPEFCKKADLKILEYSHSAGFQSSDSGCIGIIFPSSFCKNLAIC